MDEFDSVFKARIKARIENILSKILSDKHDAKITIKFRKEKNQNGDNLKAGTIEEKQIPYK